uniref:transposase zinc-binding domain-containing protein n=1 Tax=Clostridium thailandense TaxID=2794346 RepID=UPI001FE5F3DA|nr:transposase zinc-binding domain-containing protein [Clostridium thailandense]
MGVIKEIFKDHWKDFVVLYSNKIRKTIFSEVEKMLECGSLEKGFIEFKCEACGETKRVGFRFKMESTCTYACY